MQSLFRSALLGVLALAPGAALAQMVVAEPPMAAEEAVPEAPMMAAPAPMAPPPMTMMGGPVNEESAGMIAMMNGMATVEDVDHRFWDGNYEVEGADASGNDMEMVIDAESGAVISTDD